MCRMSVVGGFENEIDDKQQKQQQKMGKIAK